MLAGIARSTYYSWLSRGRHARESHASGLTLSPKEKPFLDFLDSVERASIAPEIGALRIIQRAADGGSWRAAAWFLERRYPHKWGPGRKEDPDLSRPNREVGRPSQVTAEDLERRIAALLGELKHR